MRFSLVLALLVSRPLFGQDSTSFVPFPETAAYSVADRGAVFLEEMADLADAYSAGADAESVGVSVGEVLGKARVDARVALYLTAIACRRHEDPSDYVVMFLLNDVDTALNEASRAVGEEAFSLAMRSLAREGRRAAEAFRRNADRVTKECATPTEPR